MMLHPPPSDADLSQSYNENYWLLDGSNEERQHFSDLKQTTARAYLDLIRRCLGRHGGRLLAVGSEGGDLLAAAADLGYDVTGVECSKYACARARERLEYRGRIIQGDITCLREE